MPLRKLPQLFPFWTDFKSDCASITRTNQAFQWYLTIRNTPTFAYFFLPVKQSNSGDCELLSRFVQNSELATVVYCNVMNKTDINKQHQGLNEVMSVMSSTCNLDDALADMTTDVHSFKHSRYLITILFIYYTNRQN